MYGGSPLHPRMDGQTHMIEKITFLQFRYPAVVGEILFNFKVGVQRADK